MDNEKKPTEEELQEMYLNTMTEREKQGLEIAKSHLGMTYQTNKSNGYLQWKKENNY